MPRKSNQALSHGAKKEIISGGVLNPYEMLGLMATSGCVVVRGCDAGLFAQTVASILERGEKVMLGKSSWGDRTWLRIYPQTGDAVYAEFNGPDELDNFCMRLQDAIKAVAHPVHEGTATAVPIPALSGGTETPKSSGGTP